MSNFPKAAATGKRELPVTLFYTVVFDHIAEDYILAGVFNTKREADLYLEGVKDWCAENKKTFAGVVEEMTWPQFLEFAKRNAASR